MKNIPALVFWKCCWESSDFFSLFIFCSHAFLMLRFRSFVQRISYAQTFNFLWKARRKKTKETFILVRYFKAHEIIEIAYANCLTQNFHSNISMQHVDAYNGKFHVKLYFCTTSFLRSLSIFRSFICNQASLPINHIFEHYRIHSFKVCVRLFEVPLVVGASAIGSNFVLHFYSIYSTI